LAFFFFCSLLTLFIFLKRGTAVRLNHDQEAKANEVYFVFICLENTPFPLSTMQISFVHILAPNSQPFSTNPQSR